MSMVISMVIDVKYLTTTITNSPRPQGTASPVGYGERVEMARRMSGSGNMLFPTGMGRRHRGLFNDCMCMIALWFNRGTGFKPQIQCLRYSPKEILDKTKICIFQVFKTPE